MQPQTTELWENESHFRTLTISPIKVTQEHIDKGKKCASGKCALALAFNSKMRSPTLLHDHPNLWYARANPEWIRIYDNIRAHGYSTHRLLFNIDWAIGSWVREFDFTPDNMAPKQARNYKSVKPITIVYNPKKEQFEIQT